MGQVTFIEFSGAVTVIRFRTLRAAREAARLSYGKGIYKAIFAGRAE